MGSEARTTRVLFREPRILRIFVMCSVEMLEPTVFTLLFLRSVMMSIMNFVRTERDCSPALAMAGWIRRTMSFREEGSSCRSWGPESDLLAYGHMEGQEGGVLLMTLRRSSVLSSVISCTKMRM